MEGWWCWDIMYCTRKHITLQVSKWQFSFMWPCHSSSAVLSLGVLSPPSWQRKAQIHARPQRIVSFTPSLPLWVWPIHAPSPLDHPLTQTVTRVQGKQPPSRLPKPVTPADKWRWLSKRCRHRHLISDWEYYIWRTGNYCSLSVTQHMLRQQRYCVAGAPCSWMYF